MLSENRTQGDCARGWWIGAVIASLALAMVLTACGADVGTALAAAPASATPALAPEPVGTAGLRGPGVFAPHAELRALAERIADALADDDPPEAVALLESERAKGYDCDFKATFNGHAGFASVEKAETEARRTARRRGATDFAVATRALSAGILGVLVMDWCPKGSG